MTIVKGDSYPASGTASTIGIAIISTVLDILLRSAITGASGSGISGNNNDVGFLSCSNVRGKYWSTSTVILPQEGFYCRFRSPSMGFHFRRTTGTLPNLGPWDRVYLELFRGEISLVRGVGKQLKSEEHNEVDRRHEGSNGIQPWAWIR